MLKEAGHECYLTHVSSLFGSMAEDDVYSTRSFESVVFSQIGLPILYGRKAYDAMQKADVIVIERLLVSPIFPKIERFKLQGKKVFATFDDGYHFMPLDDTVKDSKLGILGPQGNWRGGKKARGGSGDLRDDFRKGLALCNGAMVPSKLLLQDYFPYQSNIQYVPNYLYPPLWRNPFTSNPSIMTIGWGGTTLHNLSWKESGIVPALGKICKKYPRVQVHLQPAYPDVVSAFKKMGVRFVTGNWQPFNEWPRTVSQFYIGVAPLSGGNYDSRRSNLKALEYATAGIPWVATDDAPYKEAIGGIFVHNKSSEWYNAIEELISNLVLYRKLSEEGHEWAREFNSHCAERYLEVFNG